jgi:ATP-binding cassette subfamily F protein uup
MTIFALRSLKKDFGMGEGDKVRLIGTNGSGKSTLVKMIAGLDLIDGSKIWINSRARCDQ